MQSAFVKLMLRAVAIFSATIALGVSCSTPPPAAPQATPAERSEQDIEFARQFESKLKFKQNTEVLVYLRGLTQTLADATPELRSSGAGVMIIQDRGGVWRNYAFPGNRIYLSVGLLKSIEYENELAAAIAIELGHVLAHHAIDRIQEETLRLRKANTATDYPAVVGLLPAGVTEKPKPIDYLGPTGVFAFTDSYAIAAVEAAVDILYRTGYDPRGLVALLNSFENEPEHSPYDDDLLQKLLENARRVIALHSPLRNPIIRSQAFLSIQKRMHKL